MDFGNKILAMLSIKQLKEQLTPPSPEILNLSSSDFLELKKTLEISALEQDLLTMLLFNEQLFGLQFVQLMNDRGRPGGKCLGVGSLYPSLHRLEKKKLVKTSWGKESEGPRRKYYQLTKSGLLALLARREFRKRLEVPLGQD